nr:sialidase family protein [bacterium]
GGGPARSGVAAWFIWARGSHPSIGRGLRAGLSRIAHGMPGADGETWPVARMIHSGPAAYSDLVVLPDGTIGCLYERGEENPYETIAFARLTLEWLTEGQDRLEPR